jgi:hypothetical protein
MLRIRKPFAGTYTLCRHTWGCAAVLPGITTWACGAVRSSTRSTSPRWREESPTVWLTDQSSGLHRHHHHLCRRRLLHTRLQDPHLRPVRQSPSLRRLLCAHTLLLLDSRGCEKKSVAAYPHGVHIGTGHCERDHTGTATGELQLMTDGLVSG